MHVMGLNTHQLRCHYADQNLMLKGEGIAAVGTSPAFEKRRWGSRQGRTFGLVAQREEVTPERGHVATRKCRGDPKGDLKKTSADDHNIIAVIVAACGRVDFVRARIQDRVEPFRQRSLGLGNDLRCHFERGVETVFLAPRKPLPRGRRPWLCEHEENDDGCNEPGPGALQDG
jgi:hypothetical protein